MKKIVSIAANEWRIVSRNRSASIIVAVFVFILSIATYVGLNNSKKQNEFREKYQTIVKQQWENQPNRHPHRVSHYGYLVFREKPPLSFFDFGIESFVGNSVFLEAHRQNTVNLSEAEFSSGFLRFGELSMALVFQLLFPLLIIFLGYSCLSGLRENGLLRLIFTQSISPRKLLWGKILGIFSIAEVLFLLFLCVCLVINNHFLVNEITSDFLVRSLVLFLVYSFYLGIFSWLTVIVSSLTNKSSNTLIILLLIWMANCVVVPKLSQNLGENIYPSPTKIAFDESIHAEVVEYGNPHDPDDPHFAEFKKEVLSKYNVSHVDSLPVNYKGIQMAEGERITSSIFNRHYDSLINCYRDQNSINKNLGFINPYIWINNASMAVAGTDLEHYSDFQKQAESYRYGQTQFLNKLHKEEAHSHEHRVDHDLYNHRKTFAYQARLFSWTLKRYHVLVYHMLFWLFFMIAVVSWHSKKMKAI